MLDFLRALARMIADDLDLGNGYNSPARWAARNRHELAEYGVVGDPEFAEWRIGYAVWPAEEPCQCEMCTR